MTTLANWKTLHSIGEQYEGAVGRAWLTSLAQPISIATVERAMSGQASVEDIYAGSEAQLTEQLLIMLRESYDNIRTFSAYHPLSDSDWRTIGIYIKEVDDKTRETIRGIIREGIEQGKGAREVGRWIREHIGLTERGWQAANRYYESLYESKLVNGVIEEKPVNGMSWEQARKRYKRYLARAINKRALLIARTETMRALNLAQQRQWQEAHATGLLPNDTYKKWIVTPDDRLCPRCRALRGKTAPLNGMFKSDLGEQLPLPPLHPGCRCAMGLEVVDVNLDYIKNILGPTGVKPEPPPEKPTRGKRAPKGKPVVDWEDKAQFGKMSKSLQEWWAPDSKSRLKWQRDMDKRYHEIHDRVKADYYPPKGFIPMGETKTEKYRRMLSEVAWLVNQDAKMRTLFGQINRRLPATMKALGMPQASQFRGVSVGAPSKRALAWKDYDCNIQWDIEFLIDTFLGMNDWSRFWHTTIHEFTHNRVFPGVTTQEAIDLYRTHPGWEEAITEGNARMLSLGALSDTNRPGGSYQRYVENFNEMAKELGYRSYADLAWIMRAAPRGGRIHYIKSLSDATGLSLEEAEAIFEKYARGMSREAMW